MTSQEKVKCPGLGRCHDKPTKEAIHRTLQGTSSPYLFSFPLIRKTNDVRIGSTLSPRQQLISCSTCRSTKTGMSTKSKKSSFTSITLIIFSCLMKSADQPESYSAILTAARTVQVHAYGTQPDVSTLRALHALDMSWMNDEASTLQELKKETRSVVSTLVTVVRFCGVVF